VEYTVRHTRPTFKSKTVLPHFFFLLLWTILGPILIRFPQPGGTVMTSIPRGTPMIQMRRILDNAVILSWKDLLRPSQRGFIQVEYVPGIHFSYLKIWQLTGKGEWSLVCEHRLSHCATVATKDGTSFSNGYHSARLAAMSCASSG
jgi:hypothetical protein